MRNLDILAAESGEHVRVLLCREEQSYVVSCQHFRMPYPVASDLLAELQAQLDLMSDIQAIADRSERTMPDRSNISRQIQRNRSTARKQESVSLMDLLAEQQEDDFDAR